MNTYMKWSCVVAFAIAAPLAFSACDVDKTQEAKLPEVNVEAKGGQLPAYDVESPEVSVDTKKVVVEVPDVDVEMPSEPDNTVTDEKDSSADDH